TGSCRGARRVYKVGPEQQCDRIPPTAPPGCEEESLHERGAGHVDYLKRREREKRESQ
ncbi:hypothetical protein WMY93_033118, partial [Mugilogobius chulae]